MPSPTLLPDYEKLGVFYLGKTYDLSAKQSTDELILYDSKDLVTHAVCVGMTGSGKTGLCLALLEEAAIDSIPAIIIDPKGDLANLLLTFPNLSASDFRPWVNDDDARKKGVTPEQFAEQQATLWKSGLEKWGQDGNRIKRLRDAADFAVYTPGSSAGIPVSILRSFAAPEQAVREDGELLRERIATTATSLLGLLGIDADPIQSREHILISTILGQAWQAGTDLDLATLIQQIQQPKATRIGVMDLESFYPSKDRFNLAMRLNNLLAAPGFSAWLEGEALDIQSLLHGPTGKPRHAIFSIAHLGDAERMFFVSLLLNQVLGWMRQQPGTTSLRAIVYMDEIFGYFPPTANPPSKAPLLTLMKQARAFGVGMVLATQNPVDLDYKGLSNAGTWFVGRLQTERDKSRLLDGLEGAAAGAGEQFDRGRMESVLAGLGNRVFLMNNVHDDAPIVFETRWVMSYLRGPLTRNQIKMLMDPLRENVQSPAAAVASTGPSASATVAPPVPAPSSVATGRPVLPPEIPQAFVPLRANPPAGAKLVYQAMVLGCAQVYFQDTKAGIDEQQDVCMLAPIREGVVAAMVQWSTAQDVDYSEKDLESEPASDIEGIKPVFADLPAAASKAKSFDTWKKQLTDTLYRGREIELFRSPTLKQTSKPGESERDFRVRMQQASRESRDEAVANLRAKYAPKIVALNDKLRRAQQAIDREREQANAAKMGTAISIGSTILGAIFGRKTVSAGTIGRATTAARGASRSYKEGQDVARAGESADAIRQQIADMEAQLDAEVHDLAIDHDVSTETLEQISLKPKKSNVGVRSVVLAWAPFWQVGNDLTPAS